MNLNCDSPTFATLLCVVLGSSLVSAAQVQPPADRPVLRVVYFTPTDREPEPDRVERLDRVMTEIQRFFREGMQQNGHGALTFELERDENGRLRLHEVLGQHEMRAYGRDASRKVFTEVAAELARQGIDARRETIVIFQQLLEWDDGVATEIGPYVGGGDAYGGAAWVFDDRRLDPRLLPSKEPGGYYGGPCSLGQFNTHYLGGVAHELGHGLGLPHERERPSDTARRGVSLMGAGNHSYGRELRGEGRGAFLTAAAALPLSVHPLFTGRRQPRAELTCTVVEIKATPGERRLTLDGRLAGDMRVVGIVAYNDPRSARADYDSSGWVSPVDGEGRFRFVIQDLEPGVYDLRLRALGSHGESKVFSLTYEVDATGRPAVETLLEAPWITRSYEALRAGDRERLAAIAAEARQAQPTADRLHRKLAHFLRLNEQRPPQAIDKLPASATSVALSDLVLEAASTGWGRAVRNGVFLDGDATGLLEVGGEFFPSGLYAHAPARHAVHLGRRWSKLTTRFGLQDRHTGSVVFVIKADGEERFRSPTVEDHQVREATVDVSGVALLELIVEDAGDGRTRDWAVWLDPQLHR